MFEGQPKGLYALALANTGERFGYYTMLAIFTLFLQAKFGYTAAETSTIFGCFLAAVYFIPFFGGILADKFGYGKMRRRPVPRGSRGPVLRGPGLRPLQRVLELRRPSFCFWTVRPERSVGVPLGVNCEARGDLPS